MLTKITSVNTVHKILHGPIEPNYTIISEKEEKKLVGAIDIPPANIPTIPPLIRAAWDADAAVASASTGGVK